MKGTVQDSPFHTVLRNFTLLSVAEIIGKVLLFVATVHLARTLGPAGFGLIGFALAVVTYFRMIVDFGLGVHGTRAIAKNSEESDTVVSCILFLRIILVFVALAAVYLFTRLVERSVLEENLFLLYALTFVPFAILLDWYFYGKERAGWAATGSLITQIVFAAGVFLLIRQPLDIYQVPIVQSFAELFGALVLLAAYFKYGKVDLSSINLKRLKGILSASAPIALSNAMRTVNFTFDIVLIGFLFPPEPVGWYTAAYRFVYLLVGFGMLYFQAFLAPISRSVQESPESASILLTESVKAGAVVVLPAAAGTTLLAGPLLRSVYGSGFEGAIVPLQILIWSAALIILNGNFRQTVIAFEEQRKLLAFTAASAALNIALNFLLIPGYGLAGAASATVLSELLLLALCFRHVAGRRIRISFGSALPGPLICTLLMCGVLYLTMQSGLVAAICCGIISYIAALIVTRTVRLGT